jgi:hypothetical protein
MQYFLLLSQGKSISQNMGIDFHHPKMHFWPLEAGKSISPDMGIDFQHEKCFFCSKSSRNAFLATGSREIDFPKCGNRFPTQKMFFWLLGAGKSITQDMEIDFHHKKCFFAFILMHGLICEA